MFSVLLVDRRSSKLKGRTMFETSVLYITGPVDEP